MKEYINTFMGLYFDFYSLIINFMNEYKVTII